MRTPEQFWERMSMLAAGVLALLLIQAFKPAHADLITEIGGGYKFAYSQAFNPDCTRALVVESRDGWGMDGIYRKTIDCGGDNPVFIGWPLAWEFPNGLTFGWFHMSNWFDGGELSKVTRFGDEHELAFNCLCASHRFHWGSRRRK